MHVLHLPPRQLWRITAIAAVLAVASAGIILLALGRIGSSATSSTGEAASPAPVPARQAPAHQVRVPLAPPTVFNEPLRDPLRDLLAPVAPAGGSRGQPGPARATSDSVR